MDKLKPLPELQHFSGLSALVFEKDNLKKSNRERQDRFEEIFGFYNGDPLMTEEDADDENLEDITNRLIGYKNLEKVETRFYGMWSTSNKFIDVKVVGEEINDIDKDRFGKTVNQSINKAMRKSTRFGAFFRSLVGELAVGGRAACIHKEDSDWCPSVAPKILVPDSAGTDASELPYVIAPKELTEMQLETLRKDSSAEVNDVVIGQLIETIKDHIEGDDRTLNDESENENRSANNTDKGSEEGNKTTANLWYYYEPRFDEDSGSKVVDLLIFTEDFRSIRSEDDTTSSFEWVAYYDGWYDSVPEWMHLVVLDATIGGQKSFATAKGIAEITYNSDMDSEDLMNRIITGEKMRAVPRFKEGDGSSEDALLGWNPHESSMVPRGIEEFKFQSNTGGLGLPLSFLRSNSATQSGGDISNSGRGGELRTQSVQRESTNQASLSSKVADLHKSLEVIAQEIVRRFFVGDIEGGSPGYEEIMWFRSQVKKEEGLDLKYLAKQSYGFFENIEVSVVRSSISGESDQDLAVARELMSNIGNYPSAVRPFIVNRFTTLITADPDFADQLVDLLPKVVSAQRVTAESEFEHIKRDSLIEEVVPLGADDVHLEHAGTHMKHLRIIINISNVRPWTREDATFFAAMQLHTQQHITELIQNGATRADGEIVNQEFAQLVAAGDDLTTEAIERERQEQGQAGGLDFDQEMKTREADRKDRELQIKALDTQSTIEQRTNRQDSIKRKGDQSFLIQKAKLEREGQ